MKLLVVAQSYSSYILSNPLYVAEGLAERGHDVQLLTSHAQSDREAPYPAEDAIWASRWKFELRSVRHLGVLKDDVLCLPPFGVLDRDYDFVLLQEEYPLLSQYGGLWAIRRGIPFMISTQRYYYPPDPVGRRVLKLLDRTISPRMWVRSSRITFHSLASYAFFSSLPAPRGKFEYIPSGLDTHRFSTTRVPPVAGLFSESKDTTKLLCVARLHPHKGIQYLLHAVAESIRKGLRLELAIIGRGHLEASLRELIRQLHVEDYVRLLSTPIPNEQMPGVYPSCDIYVQPSLVEPFGTAVAEAMASGRPTICSSVGGLKDLVADRETGLLVPPRDPHDLADAIHTLVTDPVQRSEMGQAGRARANTLFDYRVQSRQYEALMDASTG